MKVDECEIGGITPISIQPSRSFIMKKLAALMTVIFAFSIPLAGCNTMKGAGQDIQRGGEKLENSADKKM